MKTHYGQENLLIKKTFNWGLLTLSEVLCMIFMAGSMVADRQADRYEAGEVTESSISGSTCSKKRD